MSTIDTVQPEDLVDAARSCRDRSHVPYSKFRAGAAVASGDQVVPGVIVENVSLGLAMCAERVALFSAVAQGLPPEALALVAPKTSGSQTWPCGACLQVALELAGPDLVVHVGGVDPATPIASSTVGALLPRGPMIDR
ncbi:MAG TPA: cytidine deaminase [Ilumatobacteraceae bacterium]|nr:cytidine deaminase [Ilumatobacteraceae bacterium]